MGGDSSNAGIWEELQEERAKVSKLEEELRNAAEAGHLLLERGRQAEADAEIQRELEEQLENAAHAGQHLLQRNQEADVEIERLTDLVTATHDAEQSEQDINRLTDLVASLEQKNDILHRELDEGVRRRLETENANLKEELRNLSRSRESEHIEIEDELASLSAQCQSFRDVEDNLRRQVDEKQVQENELRSEIARLSVKPLSGHQASKRRRSRSKSKSAEDRHWKLKVAGLESSLDQVNELNAALHCRLEEFEQALEEAAQDFKELQETLANTEERCQLLQSTALEAHVLLDDAKCDSQAQLHRAQELHHALEEERYKVSATEVPSVAPTKAWFGLAGIGLWNKQSPEVAQPLCLNKEIVADEAFATGHESSGLAANLKLSGLSIWNKRPGAQAEMQRPAKVTLPVTEKSRAPGQVHGLNVNLRLRGGVSRAVVQETQESAVEEFRISKPEVYNLGEPDSDSSGILYSDSDGGETVESEGCESA